MKNINKRFQDILNAINSIESYKVEDYSAFLEDEKTQDAVMYNLIIMGEAANQIPESIRDDHSEIPWASLIGTRNVIVHGYDQVKLLIVWDILQKDLPRLKENLQKLI
jgi:uncharacterized protein with HEPN domain